MSSTIAMPATRFEMRFQSLFDDHRSLSFPCDAHGRVELDALSERALANYFYARTCIGREFAAPAVTRRLA